MSRQGGVSDGCTGVAALRIGVVREIKQAERRVALTPAGARELASLGHEVLVEQGAGAGSAFADDAYASVGARVVPYAEEVWRDSELLLKVKEPIEPEYGLMHERLTLFTYLHLAPDRPLTEALLASGATAIAYETVETADGRLPLLAPMSEIAGRLAAQAGAYFLQAPLGGPGVLIGGVPGVAPARIVVIGGGVVGTQAARIALGTEAEVTILERSLDRLRELDEYFGARARILMSDALILEEALREADVVIGAVLVPGALAPRLVTREMLGQMKPHAVIVDVAIDQGGCFETSRPTTHADPVYEVDGVLHYCVANMPGAVPVTATRALTNATMPYVRRLAQEGIDAALADDPCFAQGLNVKEGEIVYEPVARAYAEGTPVAAW
jgi:alanine dehydrogenase